MRFGKIVADTFEQLNKSRHFPDSLEHREDCPTAQNIVEFFSSQPQPPQNKSAT